MFSSNEMGSLRELACAVLVERVIPKLFAREDICGRDGTLYMRRWRLLGKDGILGRNLMVHRIVRPDEDRAPHDHPWSFVSLVLRGGYLEQRQNSSGSVWWVRWRRPGSIAWRRATDLHRIHTIGGPEAWTLVATGPRVRSWGFQTVNGWVDHRAYFEIGSRHLGVS